MAETNKTFRIEELANSKTTLKVKFEWTAKNHSIPRELGFGVKQRTVREDLAGSEEPVEQILGWNYTNFTLTGVWDDRYNSPGFAANTWRNFEALVKRGSMVQITFDQFSMTGLITDLKLGYKRADLISYEFDFSPHKRVTDDKVRKSAIKKEASVISPKVIGKRARAALDALKASQALAKANNLSSIQGMMSGDTFAKINADLDKISDKMAKFDNLVNTQLTSPIQDAANVLSRMASILASVKTSCQSALTNLQNSKSTVELAFERAENTIEYENWSRGLKAQLRILFGTSHDYEQNLKTRSAPRAAKLHRAKEGERLSSISLTYYGTPHRWREIAVANGLTKIILEGGELLIIPDTQTKGL